MADWKQIEAEYLTGRVSYRKLAEKYSLPVHTVADKGRRGRWVQKRLSHEDHVREQVLKADEAQILARTARLMEVADKLLLRVEELGGDAGISPGAVKTLTEALKNIRDAQMIRSAGDLQEQLARIEKLRKEANRTENEGTAITVTLAGTVGEFAA